MYTNHILMHILEINIFMEQILYLFQNLLKPLFNAAISGRGMRFSARPCLVLTLRMSGVLLPLPPHTFVVWIGTNLLYIINGKNFVFEITMPSAYVCVCVCVCVCYALQI